MVPLESQIVVEKNSSTSVDAEEQLVSGKDQNISTTALHGASSLKSPNGAEEASFMGKGGEQFSHQPNVYDSRPQTIFSGGFLDHVGQWKEYPYAVTAEGLDDASHVMYGVYSPLSTIGDSQAYFSLHYPLSNPYYQPSGTGIPYFDPMHQYYLPDGLLYSPTPGFHQPFDSFNGVPMQSSTPPGFLGQGNIPLTSEMHHKSMHSSGSYKALQQGGKFGGGTSRWSTASRRHGAFYRTFKHEKSSLNFLDEQNRGPRARKTHKEVDSSSTEGKNKKALSIVDSEKYNHADFATAYKDAKFFVIKSYTEDHVYKSIKYNVWSSTASGNRKLNVAYHDAKEKEHHCPIFLFFSVNGSGQFCGLAEMIGPVDFDKSVNYWQNDRWSGQFPVKWHIVKDVPNNLVRHITLENNENKPVTNSRDTQEVRLEQGLQMLTVFKNHESETTILEDFDFYEQRENSMLDNRQQDKLHCVNADAQKLGEVSAPVDIMTRISAAFARAVQLEETKAKENSPGTEGSASAAAAAAVKIKKAVSKPVEPGNLMEGSS